MPSGRRTLGRSFLWPLRRILDPRFADVNRRLSDMHQSVRDEGQSTRAAIGTLTDNFKTVVGGYAETNVEALTHLGVEMRRLQDHVANLDEDVVRLRDEVSRQAYITRVDALARGSVEDLDTAAANLINYAHSHRGFAAQAELWINDPVTVAHEAGAVRWTNTNERIVEVPFTLAAIAALPKPSRILDVGSAESTIALSLASLGHYVTALDPRGYPYEHPNLTPAKTVIEDFEPEAGELYDAILLVSTIEHVGLGFYGEEGSADGADRRALERLGGFLAPGGMLVLTVPYGQASVTEKERTYDAEQLDALLAGWSIVRREVAERRDARTWLSTDVPTGSGVAMVITQKA